MRKLAVRALLTIIFIAVLVASVDLAQTQAVLTSAQPLWLAAAVGVSLLATLAGALRWHGILQGAGLDVRLLRALRVGLSSLFFSLFTPSSIGGDVMKVVLLELGPRERDTAISTVLLDRVIGLAVTVAVGIAAVALLPSTWGSGALVGSLALTALGFGAGVAALLSPRLLDLAGRVLPDALWRRLGPSLLRVNGALRAFGRRPGVLWGAAAISLLRQVLICVSAYYGGRAFGIQASLAAYFAVVPLTLALITLPLSINGLGLQDNAMVLLLGAVGVAAPQALTLSLFLHLLNNGTALLGGLILLCSRRPRRPDTNQHARTTSPGGSTAHPS